MKRKRILRSTPAYPVRSRRYYADLEQMDHEAAVKRAAKAREDAEARTQELASDAPKKTDKTQERVKP